MLKRIAIVLAVVAGSLVGAAFTAASSNAATANCSGNYNNDTFGSVIVQPWTICRISNSTITGSVTVKPNAAFETCNDLIKGSVNATQAYVNIDNRTEVDGSITLLNPGTQLSGGNNNCSTDGPSGYSSYLCPHYIGGNLNIQNTAKYKNYTEVGDCGWVNIHGSFTISDNKSLVEAGEFSTGGSLVCLNNWPQPEFFPVIYVGSQNIGCYIPTGGGL
ncbi:MAG TPA: hypothetical protein VGN35_09755 [Jatrophihabitantaceae bacterium]|nr:hypothetical protein [Jatrophihabitantaceae bacterium]